MYAGRFGDFALDADFDKGEIVITITENEEHQDKVEDSAFGMVTWQSKQKWVARIPMVTAEQDHLNQVMAKARQKRQQKDMDDLEEQARKKTKNLIHRVLNGGPERKD